MVVEVDLGHRKFLQTEKSFSQKFAKITNLNISSAAADEIFTRASGLPERRLLLAKNFGVRG
jgi:hypothetical protein